METIIEKFSNPNLEIQPFRILYSKVHFALWMSGIYPDQKSYIHNLWRCINISMDFSGLIVLMHAAIEDIKMEEYNDATRQLAIFTLFVTMLAKFSNFLYNRDTIESLIFRMDKCYEETKTNPSKEEVVIIRRSAQLSVSMQNIWFVLVTLTGGIFSFSAFGIMLYLTFSDAPFEKKMIFYTIFPYVDHLKFISPYYELSLIYELFLNFFVTIIYIGYDPLIPIFVLFVCGQFEVIETRVKNVFKSKDQSQKKIHENLVKIIEDLQAVYDFAEDFNKSTFVVSQLIFVVSPVMTTVSGFQIYSMLKNGEFPYEFVFFCGTALFHAFMPCYFGNILEERSLSVANALYECGWEDCPYVPIRKTVLLMIVRSQKPVVLHTVFSTINLALFSEVCQTIWAMFNLLIVAFDG